MLPREARAGMNPGSDTATLIPSGTRRCSS